ncbi:MAG: SusC/RagA family TonB-linked outer membrane protein [Bacteroidaceae bacterium]|nr:SusC/RagA family TonB-linked outer membrane protein [Bacteroidaceae bacterium]
MKAKIDFVELKVQIAILALALMPMGVSAQTAGTMIHGVVQDDIEPLMACNVVEIDNTNRIVAAGVTDMNGNFSFRIVDPKHKLKISYVGYETQIIPIKGTSYKITLKSNTQLQEVVVKTTKIVQTSGLAIPERELSVAHQMIDAKEFEGLALTSVDEALQGRIAGLDIVANSGNLGAGTSMRLRGVSSINGSSEPLIVVDGNIFESDYNSNFDYANATEDQFAELLNVNPDDIASISVLKDAAGTAIYGSQGANGVIEIKTKRGARGKTKVQYSYRAMATFQPKGINLLDGDQYTMLMKEAYYNPTLSDASANIREFNYDTSWNEYEMYNNNTDWRKAIRQTGLQQQHYVSLSGGGEKANFRIAGGYDHQTGTVIEQKLDRFTTRVALDYFVSDRIKIVTNFNLTYTDNKKNYKDNSIVKDDLLGIAYVKMPNLSIYEQDAQGHDLPDYYHMLNTASAELLRDQYTYVNPVALAKQAKNEESTYQIQPEFQLHYNLLGTSADQTQLKYEGKILFNIFNKYNDTFYPSSLVTNGWSDTSNNKTTSDAHKSTAVTTTHRLTFQPHFNNEDHSFMAMAQFQLTDGSSKSTGSSVWGLPSGGIQSPIADGIVSNLSTSSGQWRSVYLTFSAHYAYKGRYIADFSVRRDGSTKFGDDSRWGNFPALSFRWNVSDEPFMERIKWLDMLSIRPGWGKVGSQPGGEYLYFSKYTNGTAYNGNGSVYPSNIRLSGLKWEEKETWNIGFDLGFLDNRLTADFNIYTQHTSDLLMLNRKIPTSSGFTALAYQNVGDMVNNGWEFNINGQDIIKAGKFRANFNVSFANNKNEITKMDETVLASLNSDFSKDNGSYLTRVQLHNAFGSIYGFRYKGVYQYSKYSDVEVPGVSGPNAPVARDAEGNVVVDKSGYTTPMVFCYDSNDKSYIYEFKGGDAIYEDINHDGNINELDIVYLGSSLPKITGGWGFKLTYGRWSWNNQFNFRVGNKIVNRARMLAENMYSNNNQSTAVNWRWRVEGDNAEVPRALYRAGYNWLGSDRFVENGSFLRLNYTQISYSLDPKLIKNWGLSQLSFYVNANNLFCFTGYSGADPEVGYGGYGVTYDTAKTPRSRSVTFGLTVQF